MIKKPRLENWSVTFGDVDPYTAPELLRPRLQGNVYNSNRFTDGEFILTGPLISAQGRQAATKQTVYILGEVDPQYRAWLAEHRPDWDPENPIIVRRGSDVSQGDEAGV